MQKLSKTKLGIYSQLASAKSRRKYGLFRAEGEKCVADTIGCFTLECLIVSEGFMQDSIRSRESDPAGLLPEYAGFCDEELIRVASESEMKKLSSMSNTPGLVAVYKLPELREETPVVKKDGLYVLLDGIQDPGNLGTILRAAHWYGVDGVFASKDTVDIFNPKSIQATMGSIGHVEIRYTDICTLVRNNPDIPLFATALEGENIYSVDLPKGAFIAMGSEGHGISDELRALVGSPLYIPPYDKRNHAESLNVSVATAIVLSEFRRKYLGDLK
ncbi:MAG: RNA methyltransferase [Bacteroidales bacterium]|nr:RNA methyltransferase [Bacteroidales bacterium]